MKSWVRSWRFLTLVVVLLVGGETFINMLLGRFLAHYQISSGIEPLSLTQG